MSGTSVRNQKHLRKVSIYLMTFLAMAGLLAPIADASHCTALKDKADDAKEDWAAATAFYTTTAAAMTITCAQAAKTKNRYLVAACTAAIAATAAAGWYMGVQAGRYYEAADKYAACQREHDPN